ncbi:MAG: matrixin family metalloprotease [Myxococcaceae bacterium]|nr:matrixin family metalloprotease [Myxococcaceae bacterium]
MRRLAATALLLWGSLASAQYVRTPVGDPDSTLCVTWNRRDFTYDIDSVGSTRTPGEAEFTAIDAAFATWQGVSNDCSDFQFIKGQRVQNAHVAKGTQMQNVITWWENTCDVAVPQDDPCLSGDANACINQYRCWFHGQFTLALTTTTYSVRTGSIYDADIEMNGADWLFTTISSPPCKEGSEAVTCVATDVQNTLTHEIGHAVGFDHSETEGSTMEPTAPLGQITKRLIDHGTKEGFCTTYPRGGPPTPCDLAGLARRKIVASQTGTPALGDLGCSSVLGPAELLLALVATRLLRRRRT